MKKILFFFCLSIAWITPIYANDETYREVTHKDLIELFACIWLEYTPYIQQFYESYYENITN